MIVTDEANRPLAGVDVQMSFYVKQPPDTSIAGESIHMITDTNGFSKTVHENTGSISLGFQATRLGYYSSHKGHEFHRYKDNDPSKWSPVVTLILKKIGTPIPMYAKRLETQIQKENEPVGFDLSAGDWVAPFGTGKSTDIFFTVRRKIISLLDYDCELRINFPNKGDGIAVAQAEIDGGSTFQTSRMAANNGYQPELVLHYRTGEWPKAVFGYFLRVRTVLDENGNVRSALYGKIRSGFRFYPGTQAPRAGMGFDYYLNPTANDLNLEFDPQKNLLKNLKSTEQIRSP